MDPYLTLLTDTGDSEPSCRRSLWKIIWSCIATLFACTWVAIHPNVALERETWGVVLWRRAGLMISMIVVPEMVVCWALRQFVLASYIGRKYEKDGWTRTHGFFLIMGGFYYYITDGSGIRRREVLTYKSMVALDSDIKIQERIGKAVSAKVIDDRSKADWLAKSIVIVQTLWFCLQLFTRLGQHLVVTELEISTLAFAILNYIVYLLWWDKPFDVRSQILVYTTAEGPHSSQASTIDNQGQDETKALDYISTKWTGITKQIQNANSGIIELIPSVLFGLFVAPFSTLYVEYNVFPSPGGLDPIRRAYEEDSRASEIGRHNWLMRQLFNAPIQWALVSGVAVIFGGIHLIAWFFHFPSSTEMWLWRGSAIALITPAISLQTFQLIRVYGPTIPGWADDMVLRLSMIVMVLMGVAYLLARFIILCLPLITLRKLSPGTLTEVNWAALIPHF